MAPRRTWRCPDESQLAAYFERQLEPSQHRSVEAHVSSCDYCLAQVAFLLNVEDAELPEVPRALLERARGGGSLLGTLVWKWSPVALASIMVIASLLIWRQTQAPQVQSERPPQREQASASTVAPVKPAVTAELRAASPTQQSRIQTRPSLEPRMLQPTAGAAVNAAKLELRWTAVPQALFYDIRITSPNGQLVWSAKVEEEKVQVPAEAGVQPGPYFVWVRAHLPEGKLVRTPAVSFTVQQ
jgi:hypothetical protein